MKFLKILSIILIACVSIAYSNDAFVRNQNHKLALMPGNLILMIKDSIDTNFIYGIKVTSVDSETINYVEFIPPDVYHTESFKHFATRGSYRPKWLRKPLKILQTKTLENDTNVNSVTATRYSKSLSVDSFWMLKLSSNIIRVERRKLNWHEAMSDKRNIQKIPNFELGKIIKITSMEDSIKNEYKVIRINKYGICAKQASKNILKNIIERYSKKDSLDSESKREILKSIIFIDFDALNSGNLSIELSTDNKETVFDWETLLPKAWFTLSNFQISEYSNFIAGVPFIEE